MSKRKPLSLLGKGRIIIGSIAGGLAIVALLVAAAFIAAPAREIRTEVFIDAPPSTVWTILTDAPAYGEWNPFIVSMKGEPRVGNTLDNVLRQSDGAEMAFSPRVLVATPDRELRWLGRVLMPRILDGEHYFVLTPEGDGTRLVHGEKFSGIALWVISADEFVPNFEAMNGALKTRAEAAQ